jgi:regulator of protease activity HflC (stomatin/prohibitin superfamily)
MSARIPSLSLPIGLLLVLGLIMFIPVFIWFFCRIEVEPNEIAILIRKTGKTLPSGQILAPGKDYKGIQIDVLGEGRHWRDPYNWAWRKSKATEIPAGKLGIATRLYGKDLPAGEIMAMDGTKGILKDTLPPGKYRLNPFAIRVDTADAVTIHPGHIGVVTHLVGKDILNSELSEAEKNAFLVPKDVKGVMSDVLEPGTYYLNPYLVEVVEVNLQSQPFQMSGPDAISFLTEDGFTMTVEGTIEFAVEREKAALITHRVGDMEDIMKKIVLPRARGFSRIEGSKHPAIHFIVGQTRQKFQNDLDLHLKEKTKDWGVDIRTVLIRNIIVPDQIASISRDREMAVQESRKYDQQITQAQSKAELTKQEMLAEQNKEKVEADTARIRATINAQQGQSVKIVAAQQALEVARIGLEAARYEAEAMVSFAEGERDAIRKQNEAEASVIAAQVAAFDSGMDYARYLFYQKVGPKIDTILTTDQKEGLGAIFSPFLPSGKGVSK